MEKNMLIIRDGWGREVTFQGTPEELNIAQITVESMVRAGMQLSVDIEYIPVNKKSTVVTF